MKKVFLKICLILFLLLVLVYVTNITAIPNSIILFRDEELNLGLILGVSIKEDKENFETIETSAGINNKTEKKKVTLSLFNLIDIKEIEVNTISNTTVIPLGNSVGLKLYTSRSISSRNDRNRRTKTVREYRN